MRIQELHLLTSNLSKQKDFYSNTLGFKIIEDSIECISYEVGYSILSFRESTSFTPYHYAINIPSTKENEAYECLSSKVEILKNGDNKIQYFEFWNAYAIYFLMLIIT